MVLGFREGAGAASGGYSGTTASCLHAAVLQHGTVCPGFPAVLAILRKDEFPAPWWASEPGVLTAFPGETAQMELDGV